MRNNYAVLLVIQITCVSYSSTALVTWVPDKRFNLPINFSNKKLPCSKETVVFPDTIEEALKMDGKTSVSKMILPLDGEIILNSGLIEFGANPSDQNCTEETVFYAVHEKSFWNDPDVWTSSRFNEATPDAERMPCSDDIVEFTLDAEFTVNIPLDAKVQRVKEFKTSGDTIRRGVFNNFYPWTLRTGSPPCKIVAGCACQQYPIPVNCNEKLCEKPNCVAPIKPVGNCCPICGGELIFQASEMFNFVAYKEFVGNTVESYGGNRLAYHVGKLNDGRVQVVVVNKGEYDGSSSEVANIIGHYLEKHWFRGALQEAVSGSPTSKAGLGGKIAASMFFIVVIAMAGVYVYYYRLPRISIPMLNRNPRATLSRFHRRTDSVVTLTRRDSDAAQGESNATAFRNPLYDSKRGRDGATER